MNRAPSSMTSRSTRRIIDSGSAPEGDAWAADDQIAGVSDEGDGALSRSRERGQRYAHAVALGSEQAVLDRLSGVAGRTKRAPTCSAWMRVAAESGDLTVWNIAKPGLALVGHDHPGNDSHTVAADLATHRVFFPLPTGPRSVRVSVVNVGRVLVLVLDTIVPVRM